MTDTLPENQTTEQPNNGQFKQTHGINAFADRGEKALTPARGAYLQELKNKLATNEGRIECRTELAAALGTIVEMGFSSMRHY